MEQVGPSGSRGVWDMSKSGWSQTAFLAAATAAAVAAAAAAAAAAPAAAIIISMIMSVSDY